MSTATQDKVTDGGKRTSSKGAPTAWQVMREGRTDDVHPYWVHVGASTGFAFLGVTVVSLTAHQLPWWGWLIMAFIVVSCGMIFGAAAGADAGETIQNGSMAFGFGLTTAVVLISWYAASVDFARDPLGTDAFGVYAAIFGVSIIGAAVYRWLWTIAIEIRDNRFPRERKERAKRSKNAWVLGFHETNLGDVTIEPHETVDGETVEVEDNGVRVRLFVRLDPNKPNISASTIENKKKQLVRTVSNLLKQQGDEGLGRGDIRIDETETDPELIAITVFRSDPLAGNVDPLIPATAHDFRIDDPEVPHRIGVQDTGESLLMPIAGPHKKVVGGSGSGKSNLLRGLAYAAARREFIVPTFATLEKYSIFLDPFRRAPVNVFRMTGGGDAPTLEAWTRAMCVLVSAYLLFRHRTDGANVEHYRENLRDGAWVGTPEHPTMWVILDEWDALVTFKVRGKDGIERPPKIKLPNDELVSAWDMILNMSQRTRAAGVELVLAGQRTDAASYGGNPVKSVLVNVKQKFVHATDSGYDLEAMGVNSKDIRQLNAMTHCMLTNLTSKPGSAAVFSKAAFITDDDIDVFSDLALQAGTVGGFNERETAAMGEWWFDGEVPANNPAARALGAAKASSTTASASSSTSGGKIATDIDSVRARVEAELRAKGYKNPLVGKPGQNKPAADSGGGEQQASTDDEQVPSWALEVMSGLADVTPADFGTPETADQDDDADQVPLPESPIELLGHIVDAWEEIADERPMMTPGEMVDEFSLLWLDSSGRDRPHVAAIKLGTFFREHPVKVAPRKATNKGRAYAFDDVRAAWERIESAATDSNHQDDDADN